MAEPRPSGIRAVYERALTLEGEGRSIVHLEIGRPWHPAPEPAVSAATHALAAGDHHYTQNRGRPELREALAEHLENDRLDYDPDCEIVVTAGGSEGIAAAMLALLQPGDEVVIVDPAWPHYDGHVRLAGAEPVHIDASAADGFVPDPDRVADVIGERTRMLVVSTPCNPTGAVWPASTLESLADLCERHDLLIISDEIYRRFVFEGQHASIAAIDGMRERAVVCDSFSKTWSMTGWRVGWVAAPRLVADRINAVHQHLSVCAPSFAQAGALAALREGRDHVRSMVSDYASCRHELLAGLSDLPRVRMTESPGALYAFPEIDEDDIAERLLEEAGVAVVPGAVFGSGYDRHVRIAFSVPSSELAEGVSRLRAVLA